MLCDYASYVFMFLSIATSNMVATALARQVSYGNIPTELLSVVSCNNGILIGIFENSDYVQEAYVYKNI